MGADLITITLVGPVKLKPGKRLTQRILAYAERVVDAAGTIASAIEHDENWDLVGNKYVGQFDAEDLSAIYVLNPKQVLKDLLNVWEGGPRDVSTREVTLKGTKYRIVVAGDMSWGDLPDGDGFLTLRDADRLGMLDRLGLK